MSDTTTCYTSIGFFLIPTLWKVRLQLNILWKEDHHELQIRTQTNRGISTLSHLPWLHTNFNHYQEHPNYRGLFSFLLSVAWQSSIDTKGLTVHRYNVSRGKRNRAICRHGAVLCNNNHESGNITLWPGASRWRWIKLRCRSYWSRISVITCSLL